MRAPDRARLPAARAVAAMLRRSGAKVGFALVYHRVDERAGDPAREIDPALPRALFERQMRHLASAYRAVRASELRDAIEGRRRGEPIPAAVTFDDDLPTHALVAAPVLERAGVPGTFFLSGDGDGGVRWWEDLQIAVDRKLIAAAGLGSALEPVLAPALDGKPWALHAAARQIVELAPPDRAGVAATLREAAASFRQRTSLTPAQIGELADAGHEIGFHTRRHDPLTTLDDASLAGAITDGRTDLEEVAGRRVLAIAYPHGRVDERVRDAAAAAGFDSGFTTAAEAIGRRTDQLLLGRVGPGLDSPGSFAATIARRLIEVRAETA